MASTESAPSVGPPFHGNAFSRSPMPPHAWRVRSGSNTPDPDWRSVTLIGALLSSFLVVALAEMGDKTQLVALSMASRYRRPWAVLLGILIATTVNHALAHRSELGGDPYARGRRSMGSHSRVHRVRGLDTGPG